MMEAGFSPTASPLPISKGFSARAAGDEGAKRPRAVRYAAPSLRDVCEWMRDDREIEEANRAARRRREREAVEQREEEDMRAEAARLARRSAAAAASAPALLAKPTKDVSAKRRAEGTKAAEDRRRQRFALRETLVKLSAVSRVAACGRRRISRDSGRLVRVGPDGSAHYANTQMCGSVWLCPVCSAKVRQHRAEEIQVILSKHLRSGGGAYFGMLTFPHDWGDSAKAAVDTCADAFRKVLAGRAYERDRKRFGIVGTIRSMEITHGANGYHPHIHPVFLTDRELSDTELADLRASIFERWSAAVQARGYRAPLAAFCTLSPIRSDRDVADYITKVEGVDRRVSLELARSDLKVGRESASRGEGASRGRTMWEVLEGAAAGSFRDGAIWLEYEQATLRRQAITFSKGLRARYGLIEDESDDEAAAIEQKRPAVTVYEIEDDAWYCLTRTRGGLAYVLEMAEKGAGAREIAAFLVECVEGVFGDLDRVPVRSWGARRTVRDAERSPAAARKHNFFAGA